MATLKSTNVNSGDPVTYDIINNIILDLNELNKATAAKFNLNLSQTGGKDGKDAQSQSVYSTVISGVTVNPSNKPSAKGTWTFPSKVFTAPPRCWIQVNTNGASIDEAQSRMHVVITSISLTKMTFEVRSGYGAKTAKVDFHCFAVEA
jgi:hypothetical protein